MGYLLDTNICIYIIKQKPESVIKRFRQIPLGEIGVSSITVGELDYGARKSANPKKTCPRYTNSCLHSRFSVSDLTQALNMAKYEAHWNDKELLSAL